MTNTIIRASAGTGKTFRLSNEFLNTIFAGAPLDSILVSTFTRKAAGEITDRIFTKLADAALDPNEREKLAEYLQYPCSESADNAEKEKTLQKILAELACNMYRLRVRTLDAYFNNIASTFALEMGLPPGWTIVNETEFPRLLDEAVRDAFAESKEDAKKLMHLLQSGEEKAGIMNDLVDLADTLLPLVRATTQDAWEHDRPERLGNLTHDLLAAEELDELFERLRAITDDQLPRDKNNENEPHKNYFRSRNDLIEAVRSQNWKFFFDPQNTLVKNIRTTLNEPAKPCKYCYIDVRKETPELFDIVAALLPHAKSILIKTLTGQTFATYKLLKMVAGKLDGIMERERKFRYEDITRKVAGYGFSDRLDSLKHRLNAETKHLLLDEFQDTSLQQWEILEPLALQAVGDENGTYFCVGDEKQSIYAWRGGEASIFNSMKERLEKGLKETKVIEETMEKTRRCTQPIIDTVNQVFGKIAQSPTVRKASEQAGTLWQTRFKAHTTDNTMPGYCVLEESPVQPKSNKKKTEESEETEETTDVHVHYVADRIADLIPVVQNNPEFKNGIGVLVATHDEGAKIISALKERGIETTGSGTRLLDSPAVRHVISALIFAEHPGDTVAGFHLAHGPLAEKIGLNDLDDSTCFRCSHHIRNELVNRGYGNVIGDYIEILAGSCNAIELERLEKLREVAWRFDEIATGVRTRQFVDLLKKERTVSQNAANVQVKTIHSTKGLEFDIVVLPQLDRNLKGSSRGVQYVTKNKIKEDAATPIDFVLKSPVKEIQHLLPKEYQDVFDRQTCRRVEESLCVLYVAMTRAIRALVMIVPGREKRGTGMSCENILRDLPPPRNPSAANILYEKGDPNWYGDISDTIKECAAQPVDVLTCNLAGKPIWHHVPRIVPSSQHSTAMPPTNPSKKTRLPTLPGEAALKGTAIHACFEHGITWLDDDNNSNENDLRRLIAEAFDGRKPSFGIDDVLTEFQDACRKPEIVAALSRHRYLPDKKPELERERRFAVWIDGRKIMRGSIDRLVVCHDPSGTITKIEVLDYKTGDSTDDVDVLVETYRNQMDAYRRAVCELYDVAADAVETTLVFVTIGKVVTISSTPSTDITKDR